MSGEPLLSVCALSADFTAYGHRSPVLREFSRDVPARRHVALVGESGCRGKGMTMREIMGILPATAKATSGQILFEGRDLIASREFEREALCGAAMSIVFQDPIT